MHSGYWPNLCGSKLSDGCDVLGGESEDSAVDGNLGSPRPEALLPQKKAMQFESRMPTTVDKRKVTGYSLGQ
jgi:hypothetical protein